MFGEIKKTVESGLCLTVRVRVLPYTQNVQGTQWTDSHNQYKIIISPRSIQDLGEIMQMGINLITLLKVIKIMLQQKHIVIRQPNKILMFELFFLARQLILRNIGRERGKSFKH